MRDPYLLGENGVTHLLLGFIIALAVGLTSIGGGSFTVPALLLIVGLPAGEAVGTAFVFAGVLRLIAAPFYLLGRLVISRYFRLLLQGDRKSTRLNSSHVSISYAVFCLKNKKIDTHF